MNNNDLKFLKYIQEKVQKYNSTHKQIKLVLSDIRNEELDRYDYVVDVWTSLSVNKYKNDQSVDKAVKLARSLNDFIHSSGYQKYQHSGVKINYANSF